MSLVYEAFYIFVTNFNRFAKMEEDQDMLIACVEDLRAIIDKDGKKFLKIFLDYKNCFYFLSEGDGDISKEEFVKYAANSRFIRNLLSQ